MPTVATEGVAWASTGLGLCVNEVAAALAALNFDQVAGLLGFELTSVYLLKLSASLVKVLDTVFEVEGLCFADLDVGNQCSAIQQVCVWMKLASSRFAQCFH